MRFSYAVQADCQGVHAGSHQAAVHFFRVEEAVGNHAPVMAPAADFLSYAVYVRPEQRFSSCQDNRQAAGVEPLTAGFPSAGLLIERFRLLRARRRLLF